MNLAKDSSSWERTVSVTPLPDSVRRKAALQVAARASDRGECRDLLEHLGLRDPALRTMTG
ncbi:hypothetical protein QCN29_11240 [Streptomyces sp. HNM0663]|uniref:Uncharacterized protein n=1 Tax=Streptomyces chengmaiensis TaxID=3040919 RepID=A0ABT6HLX7_9ACTN|nr:hypothetical protein [Streptomyces chengmaiensis]MDH2389356.1 hypothetical protein [Streptomyces chengmaiensis]